MLHLQKPNQLIEIMDKRRILPVLLLALLSVTTIKANDAVFYMSGASLVPVKETDISISKEILTITIGKDDYATVDVYYEFFNPKKTKTVTMAFEAMAPSYGNVNTDGTHPYIKDFTVEMNGSSLPFENALIESEYGKPTDYIPINLNEWSACDQDEEEAPCDGDVLFNDQDNTYIRFSYCYFFTANFKKGVNTVHHTYRYRMNQNVYADFVVDYWLTPAARWAGGKIGDFTIRLKSEIGRDICMVDSLFMGKPWKTNAYQYFFYHDNPYAAGGSKVEHFMLADLNRDNALEWHSTDFVPDGDITIYPADYIMPEFFWHQIADVIVNDTDGIASIYLAEDDTRYFTVFQDYAWVDKSVSHIETYRADNGQGSIYSISNKPVYVRMAPSEDAEVIQVIDVPVDIPESYACLGKNRDWFRVNVEGIIGYVYQYSVRWEAIGDRCPDPPHDFYNYLDPTSVIIPEGVTYVLENAFFKCSDIKTVSIPASVKYIGHNAFEGCSGLESVTIPDGMKAIDPWTFKNCSSLTSVVLPAGLSRIQAEAFSGCGAIKSITCNNPTPPVTFDNTFDSSIYKTAILYVPKDSKRAYETSYYWRNFKNIVAQ